VIKAQFNEWYQLPLDSITSNLIEQHLIDRSKRAGNFAETMIIPIIFTSEIGEHTTGLVRISRKIKGDRSGVWIWRPGRFCAKLASVEAMTAWRAENEHSYPNL
jgi:hypothetical protein